MSWRIVRIAWALVLSAILHGCAHGPSTDERWVSAMNEGQGMVLIDATMLLNPLITALPSQECKSVKIVLGSNVDGKLQTKSVIVETENLVLGTAIHFMAPMASGEYTVLALECSKMRLNGPHAKFQVRAGEFVNVGGLRIERQPDALFSGKMRRTVVDVRPEILAYVKERAPQAMAKMVNRPMTIVGPPEMPFRSGVRYF